MIDQIQAQQILSPIFINFFNAFDRFHESLNKYYGDIELVHRNRKFLIKNKSITFRSELSNIRTDRHHFGNIDMVTFKKISDKNLRILVDFIEDGSIIYLQLAMES